MRVVGVVVISLLCCAGAGYAGEPVPGDVGRAADQGGSALEQRLNELERLDEQLAEATRQLQAATTRPARRRLQARIHELEAAQERLLGDLERLVGPLPPAVRAEAPLPMEQQRASQERRHETTLESNVDRRLPSN